MRSSQAGSTIGGKTPVKSAPMVGPPSGINVPGTLYIGNLSTTTTVSVGVGGGLVVNNGSSASSVSMSSFGATNGSASLPSMSFTSAPSTGIFYNSGVPELGISQGGTQVMGVSTTGVRLLAPVTAGTQPLTVGAVNASGDVQYPRYTLALSNPGTTSNPISNSTATTVSWANVDTQHNFPFTVPDTVTIPIAGYYEISWGVAFAASATGVRTIGISVNGNLLARPGIQTVQPVTGDFTRVSSTIYRQCVAGDFFRLIVLQTSGGTLNLGGDTTTYPFLAVDRMHE